MFKKSVILNHLIPSLALTNALLSPTSPLRLRLRPSHLHPLASPPAGALRFNPKEDIATSVLVKSSVQRTIRAKLLAQYPLLSLPAVLPPKPEGVVVAVESDAEEHRPVGAGKKAREKKEDKRAGGKKGGKKAKADEEEVAVADEAAGAADEELTVLDVLWPKKEGLTLVKWQVEITTSRSQV